MCIGLIILIAGISYGGYSGLKRVKVKEEATSHTRKLIQEYMEETPILSEENIIKWKLPQDSINYIEL